MSGLNIVVLAKQVPDTHNVGTNAMNPDGTVNRAALPTVFNPEDLQALEMALQVKDCIPGSRVTVVTMGPARAAEIISDARSRGADDGFVLSDARFAGADTLATSYALSLAVQKVGNVDLIFSGRQAIDGDTAQVGPQVAEKLDIPQVTYAESLVNVDSDSILVIRRLADGIEEVRVGMPALITVTGSAAECRFPHAHRLIQFDGAPVDILTADDVNPDFDRLGHKGSPTKVKKVQNVVLAHKESQQVAPNAEEISTLMATLINDHII